MVGSGLGINIAGCLESDKDFVCVCLCVATVSAVNLLPIRRIQHCNCTGGVGEEGMEERDGTRRDAKRWERLRNQIFLWIWHLKLFTSSLKVEFGLLWVHPSVLFYPSVLIGLSVPTPASRYAVDYMKHISSSTCSTRFITYFLQGVPKPNVWQGNALEKYFDFALNGGGAFQHSFLTATSTRRTARW